MTQTAIRRVVRAGASLVLSIAGVFLVIACTHAQSSARVVPASAASGGPHTANDANVAMEADSLAAARRFQEASTRYAEALARWPDSVGIAARALGAFWRAARYEEGYVWGRRVLAREPDSLDVLFDVGVICGFLVELPCVDSVFHHAVALDPKFVEGHGELAFLAQARGNLPEAIAHMEAAYAADSTSDFAVSGLAQMLIPAGQSARALQLMAPRLAKNREARAYGGRSMLTLYGWALLQQGDSAGAKAAFAEQLGRLRERERLGQTTYQLYRERAAIYALEQQRDSALASMQTAFDRGWRLYGSWSLSDPMFASVADDPATLALVARMRDDVRRMRDHLGLVSSQ